MNKFIIPKRVSYIDIIEKKERKEGENMNKKVLKIINFILVGIIISFISIIIKPSTVQANSNNIVIPTITSRAHVQTYGWSKTYKKASTEKATLSVKEPSENSIIGTMGESKRMEAVEINFTAPTNVKLKYRAHVQTYGWMDWVTADTLKGTNEIGTTGESKRVEAIQIAVEGLDGYEVKYRTHVQTYGWMDWVTASNTIDLSKDPAIGTFAGTKGESKRMEAFEIAIIPKDHEHRFTEWQVTTPATCVTQGTKTRTCEICGETQTQVIKSHVIKRAEYLDKEPTCTRKGEEHYVCELCGQDFFNYIKELGHEWDNKKVVDQELTCEQDGIKSIHCKREGCTDHSEIEVTPATGHTWKTLTVEPTCTAKGAIISTCTKCGKEETKTTGRATGHNYGAYVYNNDATCTTDGTETKTCKYCSDKQTRTKIGSKTGHQMKVIKPREEATCTTDGNTALLKCEKCNYQTGGYLIKATGHDWRTESKALTDKCMGFGEERTCRKCEAFEFLDIYKPGRGHTWSTDNFETAVCTTCHRHAPNWTNEWSRTVYKPILTSVLNEYGGVPDYNSLSEAGRKELTRRLTLSGGERYRVVWVVVYTCDLEQCYGFEGKASKYDTVITADWEFKQEAPEPKNGYRFIGWYDVGTDKLHTRSTLLKTTWKDSDKLFEARYEPVN